jgi:predicted negative regulator of RcsB-dependent stress response
MASSTAARSRRPQSTINSDDAFAVRAAEAAAWAKRNARMIITIAAVALVTVGGYLVYRVNAAGKAARAAEQFLALRANPTVATAAGAGQVEAFIKAHAGTMEADEARLLLAEIRLNSGNAKAAVTALAPLAGSDSRLAAQAAMMLGSAHAQAGDRAAAIRAYQQAADKADADYQRVEALAQAALMHEQNNDFAGAVAIYERLLADAKEGSQQAQVIEMRLAEARSRAGAKP